MAVKVMLTISLLTGGGAERVVSVWANELVERGYDVSILLASRSEKEYPLSKQVKVHTIAPTFQEYKKLHWLKRLAQRRRILRDVKPNYLISFLPYIQILSMLTAFGLGIKRIETVRISPWHASMNQNIGKWLWRLCFVTGYKTILQSSDQASFFSKYIQKKSIVIPNPLSEIWLSNYKKRQALRVRRFIAAGRISQQKNYAMMIQAFAMACSTHTGDERHNDLILDIFGSEDGLGTKHLKDMIMSLNMEGKITFRGRTMELHQEYLDSDIFLMTSDYEGMPNALAEAMASGLICISTDCKTGPRDLIDDGVNGFLVPVGDVDAMAQAISRAIDMPMELRDKMSASAREKVLKLCSCENSVNKLCSILK